MQLEPARRKPALISLTPLIDVVFILLLFFMLTTQFGRPQAMQLHLPIGEASAAADNEQSLVLTLSAGGTVSLGTDEQVEPDSLFAHPEIVKALSGSTSVIVIAEDDVQLQTFTHLMDILSSMGLEKLSVEGLR